LSCILYKTVARNTYLRHVKISLEHAGKKGADYF